MAQKLISMSPKELSRYEIISNLISGQINGPDAAKQIGVSVRHVKRLKKKVIKYGAQGLIHKSRGKPSNRAISPEIRQKMEKLLKEKYYDFQPKHACEYLNEEENIKTNKETVRLTMSKLGLWKIKPRKQNNKKKHLWRPRKTTLARCNSLMAATISGLMRKSLVCCFLLMTPLGK